MACIRKRRNRWVIDFYDQNGIRRWKTLPKNATKADAKETLRRIEDMVSNETFLSSQKIPLFREVAAAWVDHKKSFLRVTVWEIYAGHLRNHFEELNEMKINRITTPVIEKWITKRQTAGMNINSLRKFIVTLNQIMAYAVRHKLINSNPVRDAERPKRTIKDQTGGNSIILNPEQIRALLDNTKEQKYRILFMTAILTGARQGEILGLKWSDVDFEKEQIHIRRTYNHGRFFPPKTKGSVRSIDYGPALIKELRLWKVASSPNENDLVFANEAGAAINHSNMVRRHFLKALHDAGLPRIRFHDLRHTYASILLQQGENIKYIQAQLGHSNPTVTLNVYSHLMKNENPEAAQRLEATIFQVNGSKMVAKKKGHIFSI